jgi:hypothetical protein
MDEYFDGIYKDDEYCFDEKYARLIGGIHERLRAILMTSYKRGLSIIGFREQLQALLSIFSKK